MKTIEAAARPQRPERSPVSEATWIRQPQEARAPIRAVVIGGSRGIGKAIVEGLIGQGDSVAVGARQTGGLLAMRAGLPTTGVNHVAECDISDPRSVERFINFGADALGGIDALINCASSFSERDDEEGWAAAFGTDLMGTVRSVHAALPFLMRSAQASVVTLSSVGARQGAPDRMPYVVMKAAIEQYTISAARLYAPARIRVNCVVAGSTDFPGGIWDRIRQASPDRYNAARRSIPLGDFATPRSIAEAALFLVSPRASWITGHCLVVDGGQTAGR
jgi:3-oxoacyl-[acyl-carrier protein] reductase